MSQQKPKNIDEYKDWLRKSQEVEVSQKTVSYYENVANRIKVDFEKSPFWTSLLTRNLREYHDEYISATSYPLLMDFSPILLIKPFDSCLLKSFRKNVTDNKKWPEEPEGGWILPRNWFSRVNDILRTLLIVKYLDGVEFVANKLKSYCTDHGTECQDFLEAREDGYYAAHLYLKRRFEIPKVDWDTEQIDVSVEVQVTTQLQEVIRKLLHRYYEQQRGKAKGQKKWQWDYGSDEFAANYLGHILHYIEGMIMDVREKQQEKMP